MVDPHLLVFCKWGNADIAMSITFLRSLQLAQRQAQDSKVVLLAPCGIGFNRPSGLWREEPFEVLLVQKQMSFLPWIRSFPSGNSGGHLGLKWLPSVRTDGAALLQATSHIFLPVCKLKPLTHDPDQPQDEQLLRRPSDVFEVCGNWNKKACGVKGSITKAPPTPAFDLGKCHFAPIHFNFPLNITSAPHRLVCKHKNNVCMRVWLIKALSLCHLSLLIITLDVL